MIADRLMPLLLSTLCLAGCAAAPSLAPDYVGRYPATDATARATSVAPDAALAMMPAAAGAVVAVRQTAFANGLRQEIVLDGPRAMAGENKIVVEALTDASSGGHGAPGDELKLAPSSDAGIQAELPTLFPGVDMQVSGDVGRGFRGSFGYASGKSGRLNCLYAWQYLAPHRALTLIEGASGTGSYPVSVKVRLCKPEPLATLLAYMRRLDVIRPDRRGPAGASLGAAPGFVAEDALDAAVGSGARPEESGAGVRLEQVEPDDVAKPSRRRLRAERTAARRHGTSRRMAALRYTGPAVDRSMVPPVPLPGDVAAPQARVQTAPVPRAAAPSADQEALPLPK